ncbi:hypothetical protein VNI00_014324 [Paramarasmius palmivorus]|uniref:Cytochrome P450 n=1 Tax=Paramarasmius palmivorus TaxID=297713 RepID=A0AAW0BTN8_9AGAR
MTFGKWSKQYGPLVYFHVFGREFLVINSFKAALDLYEHRSAIYCTKPRMVMAGELTDKEQNHIVFSKYTPRLREWRKIVHTWMGKLTSTDYMNLQQLGAARLMEALLDEPDAFSNHFRTYTGGTLLNLTYGTSYASHNDPRLALADYSARLTSEAIRPGRWLCDSFPILAKIPAWFPGAYFKRWAAHAKEMSARIIREPFEEVKAAMIDGSAQPSWVASSLLDEQARMKEGVEARDIMISAGSLYSAGTDTVSSVCTFKRQKVTCTQSVAVLRTLLLMMIRHPEYQTKAQEELDRVIGDRLPILSDRDSLPFLDCIIKECLRICAPVPLMPHSLDKDDVYEGYLIPKNTMVIVNNWQILHDPSIYPDPEAFIPERHDPSQPTGVAMDPEEICFGLGRRSCIGSNYARSWLFLVISQILAVFEIKANKDEGIPPAKFDAGHIRYPSNFSCVLKPRNRARIDEVRTMVAMSKEN